jgi:ribosomal protein S18 acetylase RimI-like enzyme
MIDIRRLRVDDDLGDLIALSHAFSREYEAHHEAFFEIDELRDTDVAAYFHAMLTRDDAAAFVAVDGERMVGYITAYVREQPPYWRVKRVGDISGLMVHPDYRRRGVGGALLRAATAFFRECGAGYYTVYTAIANEAAIRCYKRHGMTPLHTTLLGRTGLNEG